MKTKGKTLLTRAAMMLALTVLTSASVWADYGWYNASMSIGGITTDPTAWSTSGDSPTDLGLVTDMTISSVAFNVWDDSNDRGGANMFFRIWDGGDSQVGSDKDLWLGAATRITGDHDFAISYTSSYDLAAEVELFLEPGKTYYIDMWAKTYGDAGDHWYNDNGNNYHAKLTYAGPDHFSVSDNEYTYTIHTAMGWGVFCNQLNNGVSFSGKTVLLDDDIEVTTMAGSSSHKFNGTFNGQGHTLTVSYDISDQTYVAPFSYVDGATFQNLMVAGSIAASTNSAAGLIGEASNVTTVANCLVSATLSGESTFSYYAAGTAPTLTNSYYTSTVGNVGNAQGKLAYAITIDPQANMTLNDAPGVQFGSTVYAAKDETVSLTLTTPDSVPDGYEHTGYRASAGTLSGSGTSYTLAMIDVNKDVSISAFTPKTYNITYNLNGGSWDDGIILPENYNIQNDDITLPTAATKEHYDFAGWYTNSGLTGDPVTTITTGSTGNKEFWAKWTPTVYSITYNDVPNGYTIKVSDDNHPEGVYIDKMEYIISGTTYEVSKEYDSQSQSMRYIITYWGDPSTNIEFKAYMDNNSIYTGTLSLSTTGSGSFTMTYDENHTFTCPYSITQLNLNNPVTYTVESPDIILEMPQKTGYYFAGWSGTDLSAPTRDVTIFSGNAKNREYTATWVNPIDISICTVSMPDQTLKAYNETHNYMMDFTYIGITDKFDKAKDPSNYGVFSVGEEVKDGETVLTRGTDYQFGKVEILSGNGTQAGDECRVEIIGMDKYGGSRWENFTIIGESANGEWGDNLTWNLSGGALTISGSGEMKTAAAGGYPWFPYTSNITSITIGENVTTVASNAFNRTSEINVYGGVTSISLPNTLTSIGDYAFAFCTGATINLDNLPANVAIGTYAFYLVGKLVGTLTESSDNAALIELMAQAPKADVTLSGRTLKKDGSWNSLCLPFDIDDIDNYDWESGYTCPLHGATILELDNSGTTFDNSDGMLTLKFKVPTKITSIEAGKPYLVKWAKPDGYDDNPSNFDISNPTFTDVKIDKEAPILETSNGGAVTFKGSYSPYTNNEVLLKESTAAAATNAFHAFVKVNDQLTYAVEGVYGNAQFTGDKVTTLSLDADNKMVCYVKTGSLAPIATDYVDENGTAQTVNALVLDPSWTSLPEGTYVVNSDINFSNALTLGGDVTLILADGKTMRMGNSAQPMEVNGIVCDGDKNHDLTIYGQSRQTGSLKVYVLKDYEFAIAAKDIAIYGGNVTVSNVGSGYGISANSMTVKTGTVEAFGGIKGIVSDGNFSITDCQLLRASATQDYAVRAGAVTISNGTVSLNGQKGLDCSSLNISGSTVNVECTNPSTSGILSCVNVSGDATISGSKVSVNASQGANYYVGLHATSVTINGGQTTVTSESTTTNDYYRRIDAPVTFCYTNASDFIKADSYGSLTIANSQTVSDGTSEYTNVLSGNEVNAVRGKTLRPFKTLSLADNADNTTAINEWNGGMATVTLAGRTLYKDGKWNTLCLPFDVKDSDYDPTSTNTDFSRFGGRDQKPLTGSPLAGCTLKELDTEGIYSGYKTGLEADGTLYLYFKDACEIEAGKAYLIKWDGDGTNNLTESDLVFNYAIIDKNIINVNSIDEKVTFKGTYSKQTWDSEDKSILLVGVNNNNGSTLYWPQNGASIGAFRAYFQLNDVNAVREFKLNFGEDEAAGITTTDYTNLTNYSDGWYDLQGRRVSSQFSVHSSQLKKGLYIHNGRKVAIK